MTAPEPTPTAEHIDAVARSITVTSRDGNGRRVVSKDASLSVARLQARTLLASTDAAVHAAMLDALVRAGVLTEEPWRVKCLCGKTLEGSPHEVSAWTRAHDDSPKASHIVAWDPPSGKPWTRRHVTQGEVAP